MPSKETEERVLDGVPRELLTPAGKCEFVVGLPTNLWMETELTHLIHEGSFLRLASVA